MLLGKAVVAGADTEAGCLVSMGCGMAFGAVNKVLGFAGNISAIFAVLIVTKLRLNVAPRPLWR